jgi:predicted AAA+ superfamily ATPase
MIPRTLTRSINRLKEKFPVISITGPRQSGKTTLLKSCFPEYRYVSFENPDILEFVRADPRRFLKQYDNRCIFDEIQRVPELFSYLQQIVDDVNETGIFLLSGSQNFLLQERITQSLAGRVGILKLLPFSREELSATNLAPDTVNESIYSGGYPRLFDKNIAPEDYYPNYLMTYLERDVRQLKNVNDLSAFQRFVRLCAGRSGSLLNLSSLAIDCGMAHNTIRSWLSVLEASYIIFFLHPYHINFNKRLVKSPKLYFHDTGLSCSLLGIRSADELSNHPLRGLLFENFIISEFHKGHFHRGLQPDCWFWRDKTGHEIDCLFPRENRLLPVEIKSGMTVSDDYFKGLRYFNKLSGGSDGYVVYGGTDPQYRTEATVLGWKEMGKVLP